MKKIEIKIIPIKIFHEINTNRYLKIFAIASKIDYKFRMYSEYLVVLLIFFSILFGFGIFFPEKSKSLKDFFLASKSLSPFLVFLTVSASWLGASSTLVSTDDALQNGISSLWIMGLPTIFTVIIFAIFLARPIRRLPIISLPDLAEMKYSRIVRHLFSILIVWYMILLGASQMVALGKFLKIFFGTSFKYSLLLGTVVVLTYSISGGLKSVVRTDGIQLFLMTSGIVLLFFFLYKSHGIEAIRNFSLETGKTHYFNLFYNFERNILIFFSFLFAWIISPITWQRIQGARNEKSAVQGLWFSAFFLSIIYACLTFIGMMSLSNKTAGLMDSPLLSTIIINQGRSFLGLLLFLAIIAAILSTLDTAINTGALSLTQDIIGQIKPSFQSFNPVSWGRFSTFIIGIISFLIALRFQSILKTLGLASEIMTSGLFIPGIAMIFLQRKLPTAGIMSLISGSLYAGAGFLNILGNFEWGIPAWPYSIPVGLALSGSGFLIGTIIDLRNKII